MAEEANRQGYLEQYEFLRDGEVSQDEYSESVRLSIACHEDSRLEVIRSEPGFDPMTQLSLPGYNVVMNNDGDLEQADWCSLRYESYVQPAYIASNGKGIVDSVRQELVACLEGEGVELEGDEKTEEAFQETTFKHFETRSDNYGEEADEMDVYNACSGSALANYVRDDG